MHDCSAAGLPLPTPAFVLTSLARLLLLLLLLLLLALLALLALMAERSELTDTRLAMQTAKSMQRVGGAESSDAERGWYRVAPHSTPTPALRSTDLTQ
jgi:hypothetical protein